MPACETRFSCPRTSPPPTAGSPVTMPRRRPWPAYAGAAWASSYLPIHLYWAAGGTSDAIGIHTISNQFALANVAACIVILGAGATCLSLVQQWGSLLPNVLRHGIAWWGGLFGLLHAVVFGGVAVLRLVGAYDYPTVAGTTLSQLHAYDVANLVYFEPWFAVMGALLIASSAYARRHRPARATGPSAMRSLAAALMFAGVMATVAGTFSFQVWLFAGVGPALLLAGLATLVPTARRRAGEVTR